MKFTIIAIIKTDQSLLPKIEKLPKENLINFMAKKLEKPFSKYSKDDENKKFDAWKIFDAIPTKKLLTNLDILDMFPDSIFTPDCKWIDSPEAFFHVGHSNEKEYDSWVNTAKETLQKYADNSFSLLISCRL